MLLTLVSFAAGLPLAVAAQHLIRRLSVAPAVVSSSDAGFPEVRVLPWQAAPWPENLSRAFGWCMPLLLLLAAVRFDALDALAAAVTATALVICCATDLLAYRVPNLVTLPALVAILAAAAVEGFQPFMEAALTASLCTIVFTGVALVARGGLGGGDIKLVALIGAGLGFPAGPIALAAGIFAGSLTVILLHVTRSIRREDVFPFAPFLSIAALILLFV